MKQILLKSSAIIGFCLAVFANAAFAGGDSYSIYLNNKLILKEHVYQASLTLKDLQLTNTNANDMLVVFYSHCGTIGKGRSIAIKDENGKILKEWKFTDAEGKDAGMSIPVKDLLALEKSNPKSGLNIYYYSAKLLPKGQALAAIKTGSNKSTTLLHQHAQKETYFAGVFAVIALSFSRLYI